jgi:hypothetical protein
LIGPRTSTSLSSCGEAAIRRRLSSRSRPNIHKRSARLWPSHRVSILTT